MRFSSTISHAVAWTGLIASLLVWSSILHGALPPGEYEDLISQTNIRSPFKDTDSSFLVVVFLSNDCPCSNSHLAHLSRLSSTHSIPFFGIHSSPLGENEVSIRDHYVSLSPTFPILRDDAQVLVNFFRALKTPHAFVLNKNGDVLYHGAVTDSSTYDGSGANYLDEVLTRLKKGESSPWRSRPPLGCAIRRI